MGPQTINRYSRQIAVAEIGSKGQQKLSEAAVIIVGCGALGSMVAMQLAGAGVGRIGIADYDNVDISNLQRQFFFSTSQAGEPKAELLAQRINDLNPDIIVDIVKVFVNKSKAKELFRGYDFVVDATDNPDSKRMTGEVSKELGKACCIGGVRDFSGQVMTFLSDDPRFEEYFGEAGGEGFLPCSLGGVMGPAAALCASLQASETIKFITGAGSLLSGAILSFNLLDDSFSRLTLS
ncbi:MAG: HesA/MoeB/ThiF family protein [Muribaculaceae bacterium]|nr:HesA/MoeB/ThiF family protein [Muribaculaceae bacterium]